MCVEGLCVYVFVCVNSESRPDGIRAHEVVHVNFYVVVVAVSRD